MCYDSAIRKLEDREMNSQQIMRIFEDTAYIRMGGRPEEKKTADYLVRKL